MNQTIHQMKPHILPLSYENWLLTLIKPLNEHPQYSMEQGIVHIGQVAARFLGIPLDEDEYYNWLYELAYQEIPEVQLIGHEHLDKTIDNQQFQSIQKILNINHEQNLSINRFVAFLDGEQLLLKSPTPAIHRKIREAMMDTLRLVSEKETDGLKSYELQRILVDVIKWSLNRLHQMIESVNIETKEKAMIRPGFEMKDSVVKIPSIFSKIQGVSRNRKEYWERLHSLTELENSVLIKQLPITHSVNNDFRFHYRNALSTNGEFCLVFATSASSGRLMLGYFTRQSFFCHNPIYPVLKEQLTRILE